MRTFVLIFLVLLISPAMAGSKDWPGIPYSKVEVFMYNLDGKMFGAHSPVKNGKVIAERTKIIELNSEQDQKLQKWLMQDTRVLETGLSSCYIPHHAVVFYDEKNNPVAWMSVCFMCSAIRKYEPARKSAESEKSFSGKAEKKAIAQLNDLKSMVTSWGLPVFDGPEEYAKYNESLKRKPVSVTMTNSNLISELLAQNISHLNLGEFISDSLQISTKNSPKISAGGDKYFFYTSTYKNSVFEFSGIEENVSYLDYALVKDFEVGIIPAIRIGMSLAEFLSLTIYDGPSEPDIIEVTNDEKTQSLILYFNNGNLQWYEVKK